MPLNNPTKRYVKCRGCGKMILRSKFKYCHDCIDFALRFTNEGIPMEGRKSFWAYLHKHGRKCCLSGVSLEANDFNSPWYLDFCRLHPGDKRRIAPIAALFSNMKSILTRGLFRYYVLALDDNRKKHLKVKKRPIVHWRLVPAGDKKACPICGRPRLGRHKFCGRCHAIELRMRRLRLSRDVIEAVWDYLRTYGFVDYYTGMPLDTDDFKSPWYLVFDHWNPRDPRRVVVTSTLVNRMKGNLTEAEFWYYIHQLADHFRKGTPVRKIKLKFWSRPYRFSK